MHGLTIVTAYINNFRFVVKNITNHSMCLHPFHSQKSLNWLVLSCLQLWVCHHRITQSTLSSLLESLMIWHTLPAKTGSWSILIHCSSRKILIMFSKQYSCLKQDQGKFFSSERQFPKSGVISSFLLHFWKSSFSITALILFRIYKNELSAPAISIGVKKACEQAKAS